MGGRFDDTWLDDSYDDKPKGEDEFAPEDPFAGLTKREQDWFFRMLDIIPDDKREQAMDYFVDHPKKIREVIAVIKAKKKMVEEKDLAGLRATLEELRVHFTEPAPLAATVLDEDESTAADGLSDDNF